jgi:hypothetical protein
LQPLGGARAVFDCDAVALDISGFVEALQERAEVAIINMHAAEIPDHWHRRLLRARRERHCDRRTMVTVIRPSRGEVRKGISGLISRDLSSAAPLHFVSKP